MAAGICPQCGGPNPPGATVCQWCAAALEHPIPSAAVSSGYRPLDPPELDQPHSIPVPVIAGLVLVAIVGIIVVAVLASFSNPSPPDTAVDPVLVSEVVAYSGDDACSLNGNVHPGFHAPAGGLVSLEYTVYRAPGQAPCTVYSVSTDTPGFTVHAQLPFSSSGEVSGFEVTVVTPNSYDGPLNLTFS